MKQMITKEIEFDAAHSLGNGYIGKCANLHGHRYKLQITIGLNEGQNLDEFGFVMDFGELKKIWQEEFDELYDHKFLNESLGIQTTAENMSLKLFNDLSKRINNDRIRVVKIRLYETPSSYAEVDL